MEKFTYATSIDLNMGYYHITLDQHSRSLCTIVLPWGKYEYCRMPMLEGFGYKSSLMNWKPEILKMELRDKEQV